MKRAWVAVAVGIATLVALWLRGGDDDTPTRREAAGPSARGSATAQVERARLGGRVTRASDGAGIAGASVSITATTGIATLGVAPSLTHTDGDGAWTAPLAPGSYRIMASADGFVPHGEDWMATAGRHLDLALVDGGARVHGVVTDLGGGPVQGAMVTFVAGNDGIAAMTDPAGRYRLTVSAGYYEVTATHDAYAAATGSFNAQDGLDFDLVLIPAGTIRGQVVARDTGHPVPDALVEASGGIADRKTHVSARAGSDGTFVLRQLGPGALAITARARGFATRASTTVEIAVGEQLEDIRVPTDRGYTISGWLGENGKPAPGLQTLAWQDHTDDAPGSGVPSDARGAFEIVGLRPGSYRIFVTTEELQVENSATVVVTDRDLTDMTLRLVPTVHVPRPTIRGRVDPPSAATIEFLVSGEQATADASGAFSFETSHEGRDMLRATTPDGDVGVLPIPAGGALTGVVIHTSPGASVRGRVVDEAGTAIAGAGVFAPPVERERMPQGRSAIADAAGRFVIKGLPAGEVTLGATDRGPDEDRGSTVGRQTLELAAGEHRSDLVVVVEKRGREVKGTVVSATGAPVVDAWVTAQRLEPDYGGVTASSATRADGSFTIGALRAGTYSVVAIGARGESRGTAKIKAGEAGTIKLAPFGSIIGRVTRGGAPVSRFLLRCDELSSNAREIESSDGTFVLDRLVPQEYTCVATTADGVARAEVVVASGQSRVELRIPIGASVSGVAINVVTGQPIAGLTVKVTDHGASDTDQTGDGHTDASGRFVVERVPASGGLTFAIPGRFSHGNAVRFAVEDGQQLDVGVVKLEPPRTGDPGHLGFDIDYRSQPAVVAHVDPGGPASSAELRVGDQLVSYDRAPLAGLDGSFVWRLLWSASAGQTVQIGLARGVTVAVTAVAR